MRPVTAEMLAGELGSSPTVDASFELFVDSTTVNGYPMAVQLICAAPVTAFDYDSKKLKVTVEDDGDFAGRRFTFRQKDPTKTPSWGDVSFSLDGTGANWLDDAGTETLFTVRAAGFEQGFPQGYSDSDPQNQNNLLLARGGIYAADHHVRHTFDMNGAIVLSILNAGPNSVFPSVYTSGWSGIRLILKNAAALKFSDITARAFVDGSITSSPLPPKNTLLLRTDPVPGSDWLGIAIQVDELDPERIRLTIDARNQGPVGTRVGSSYPDATDPLQQTGGTGRYLMQWAFSDGSLSEFDFPQIPVTISANEVHHLNVTPATFNKGPGVTMQAFTFIDFGYDGYAIGPHRYTLVVGNGTDRSGRAATVRLGPVVEGLRTLDLSWPPNAEFHHFQGDHEIHVAIYAPILKYLLAWEKTTQIPVVENDNGGRDSTIQVYYNPAVSYASGYRGPSVGLGEWTMFSSQGLAIDMNLFVALEGLIQPDNSSLGGWRPDIAFGNPASVSLDPDAVPAVPAAYIPHAVRNIDITVTPSNETATFVEPGTERGHFS